MKHILKFNLLALVMFGDVRGTITFILGVVCTCRGLEMSVGVAVADAVPVGVPIDTLLIIGTAGPALDLKTNAFFSNLKIKTKWIY